MRLIKGVLLYFAVGAIMLALTIIGVWGFALIHIAYLKPDSGWHIRRAERLVKDSLDGLQDSALIELRAHILERDTIKVIGWDSIHTAHVRRSSYWVE